MILLSLRDRLFFALGALAVALGSSAPASAQAYKLNRSNFEFGSVAVGQTGKLSLAVTATGAAAVTVSAYSINPPQFAAAGGIYPDSTSNGGTLSYSFAFIPTMGQAYSGTLTLTINGAPVTLPMSGTGFVTGAVASVTPSVLYFNNQPQGTTSAAQAVTIKNTGTSSFNIESIAAAAPFNTSSLKTPYLLNPGESATTTVNYFAGTQSSSVGSLALQYDVISPVNAALHGTAVKATSLAVTSNPTLQLGTIGFPYLQQLVSAGGKGTVTWSLAPGASLPSALTLSSSGLLSGTIASSVTQGTHSFTIHATDSSAPPVTVSARLTLSTLGPTGASCNNISWDVAGTTTPMVDLPDLGTGTYFGTEGGLYPGGTNVEPAQHFTDGLSFAEGLTPLDTNGNPNPNGQMVLLGLGISTLLDEMITFTPIANGDPEKNPPLLVINGGEAQADAGDFANSASPYWTTLLNNIIPNAGASPNQVVAVLFEDIDASPTGTYPGDNVKLQGELESIAQNIHTFLPNVKLLFFQPRIYSGFSDGVSPVDPEPYAYEYGFAIQDTIADQINGSATLNYNPANGPVLSPWIDWGPYTWANGMIANSNGLAYSCQDFIGPKDGHHPSMKYGAPKVAEQFLTFFKTSPLATPWFLTPAPRKIQ